MILELYRGAMIAGEPILRAYLARRMARGKEDPERFCERLGQPSRARPEGPLLWLHGASVGEAMSALALISRIVARPDGWHVLVTTGTVTSSKVMAERLPEGAFHQYLPVDHPRYARMFLEHWRPDVAVWVESEFWPSLLGETARRGIPQVLLNGRVSSRSYRRWRSLWGRGAIARLLGAFSLCLGQSRDDAERLAALGAKSARYVGNLKYAAPPLPVETGRYDALVAAFSGRSVWLGASTHPGEERVLARVHATLSSDHSGLLGVIVPRHPERGAQIAAELRAMGLRVARRGAGEPVTESCDIYLADTIGELGIFYRLALIAFIGKSLTARGGQNPIEAARFGCAVVFGPAMDNFLDVAEDMLSRGAARRVTDEADLRRTVGALLDDAPGRAAMALAARAVVEEQEGVLERVLEELEPFLGPERGRS